MIWKKLFTRIELHYDCTPIFYYRYVDDTFICVKKQHIDTVIKVFNAYDMYLKFTYELEENKKINFLDITLIRTSSKILTNWYQKPTSLGRVINYFSNHPIQQKKNIIFNLVDRALLLSDSNFHLDNIKLIKNMLRNNDYHVWFIEKYIIIRYKNSTMVIHTICAKIITKNYQNCLYRSTKISIAYLIF